jgi:hypothetical protein
MALHHLNVKQGLALAGYIFITISFMVGMGFILLDKSLERRTSAVFGFVVFAVFLGMNTGEFANTLKRARA